MNSSEYIELTILLSTKTHGRNMMSTLSNFKLFLGCMEIKAKTAKTMRRRNDERKRGARGVLKRTSIMSMKSSSRISNLEPGNHKEEIPAMLHHSQRKSSSNKASTLILLELPVAMRTKATPQSSFMARMFTSTSP